MTYVPRCLRLALIVALITFNSGCSSGSGSSDGSSSITYSSFTGRASAGPINGGTVKVFKANSDGTRGSQVATGTTDLNGNYTLSVPSDSGPVFVVVTGGSYTEEASGSTVNLGSNEITAMASSTAAGKTVSVTPLTHLAAERAAQMAAIGGDISSAISSANVAVAVAAGFNSTTDITAIVPALPNQSLSSQGYATTSNEAKYGLFLAALSQYGHDNGSLSSLAVMSNFADDFKADGKFNTTGSAWTSGVTTAQTDYVNNANNAGVYDNTSTSTPVSVPPPPSPSTPWAGTKYLDGVAGTATTAVAGSATDGDGNLYVSGYTDANLDSGTYLGVSIMHAFLTKYNSAGVKQWSRLLPATVSASMAAYGIAIDGAGNIILVGSATGPIAGSSASAGGPYVVKYNSSGTKLWSQQIAAVAWGCKVTTDTTGNVIMVGVAFEGLHGNSMTGAVDVYAMKFNSSGTHLWTKQFGPANPASAALDILSGGGVATDLSDNIYIAAATEAHLVGSGMIGTIDTVVLKYNSSGGQLWIKEFGATGADSYPGYIAADPSNNIVVAGYTQGNFNGATKNGVRDGWVMKLNSSGTVAWTNLIGDSGTTTFVGAVTTDDSGNVYVTGTNSGGGVNGETLVGNSDAFLVKYNSSGALQWTKETGSVSHGATAYGVAADRSGGVFVTGTTDGTFDNTALVGDAVAFVLKYNSSGGLQ